MPEEKRIMTVVFTVKDGKINMKRTTRKFPTEDFTECVAMLQRDLDKERDSKSLSLKSLETING